MVIRRSLAVTALVVGAAGAGESSAAAAPAPDREPSEAARALPDDSIVVSQAVNKKLDNKFLARTEVIPKELRQYFVEGDKPTWVNYVDRRSPETRTKINPADKANVKGAMEKTMPK